MKILILTDYFSPSIKSGAIIMADLAHELAKIKCEPIVISFSEKQKPFIKSWSDGGVKVISIRTEDRTGNRMRRLWAEVNYSRKVISAIKKSNITAFDGLICYSPSIFYGSAINWLKSHFSLKCYLIIRDIFPKWAIEAGILRKGLFYLFLKYKEEQLYKSADKIGIEAKSDLIYFSQIVGRAKLEVLDNWGKSFDRPSSLNHKDPRLFSKKYFNIIYGGNIGDAQDLLTLLRNIDQDRYTSKIKIHIFGEGTQLSRIQKEISSANMTFIKTYKPVDRDQFIEIAKNADAGLISLNSQLRGNNYPLKMIGYLQVGLPILASVNRGNEVIDLIESENIGYVSLADDKEGINSNIGLLLENPSRNKILSKNAEMIFAERFTGALAARKVLNFFNQI